MTEFQTPLFQTPFGDSEKITKREPQAPRLASGHHYRVALAAFVLPLTTKGITPASATRRPLRSASRDGAVGELRGHDMAELRRIPYTFNYVGILNMIQGVGLCEEEPGTLMVAATDIQLHDHV